MAEKWPSTSDASNDSSSISPITVSSRAPLNGQAQYDEEACKVNSRKSLWAFLCSSHVAKDEDEKERLRQEEIASEEIASTEVLQLEKCPKGYPRAAAFLSSEPNFSLYRGFSYLHSRVLLNIQDEIVVLEGKLSELDESQKSNGQENRLESRRIDVRKSRGEAGDGNRQTILYEIQSRLALYSETLKQARELASFYRLSNRDYRSVRTWFWNIAPLTENESEFIKHKEDIISLHNGREWSTFDEIVEKLLLFPKSSWLRRIFSTPELRRKTEDENVHYYSRSRVEYFVGLIITSIIFVLLVVPVVVMYEMTSVSRAPHAMFTAIAVLIVFTLLFSAAMGALTVARRYEIFAASAAYCAVLVVFISNFGT